MKTALLQGNGMVQASDVVDVNAPYVCPYCKIPLKLKSVDGKISPYFSKMISYSHAVDCPYAIPYRQLNLNSVADRCPIEEILLSVKQSNKKNIARISAAKQTIGISSRKHNIRTPKALYSFCQSVTLDTPYRDGLTVDDILLSRRNISIGNRVQGISGIRLVVGLSLQFHSDRPYQIEGIVQEDKNHNKLYFHVFFSTRKQMQEVIDRIRAALNGRFYGQPIAVLGQWKVSSVGHIATQITSPKNFITSYIKT